MRDPDFLDAYIELLLDTWRIRIDHEDGSTALFTARAAEDVARWLGDAG